MAKETSYTNARANLASICDSVTSTRDVVIIHRRGAEDVALVSASELSSLLETAHLLRSPRNARRLRKALARARKSAIKPQTLSRFRAEVGLDSR